MIVALLTAGGVGQRVGQSVPKQFLSVNDKPLIIYTMECFQHNADVDYIAVICLKGWKSMLSSYAKQYGISKLKWIFPGGETGMESIRNGVYGLRNELTDDDIVLIQDGIRVNTSAPIVFELPRKKAMQYRLSGLRKHLSSVRITSLLLSHMTGALFCARRLHTAFFMASFMGCIKKLNAGTSLIVLRHVLCWWRWESGFISPKAAI